jgi:lysophospholipase L1-like esterase
MTLACGEDSANPGNDTETAGGAAGQSAGGAPSVGGKGSTAGAPNNLGGSAGSGGAGGKSGSSGAAGTSAGGGAAADWHFVGRFEHSATSSRFAWSGSSVSARFVGTAISVDLGDQDTSPQERSNYFIAVVDDQIQREIEVSAGRRSYKLADGLSQSAHAVTLYRLTEANQGQSEFFGFTLPAGGRFEPWTEQKSRRIEVIGDSISAGYGNEGTSKECHFSGDTENHYLTYEAIAAREVNADLITVAWSGKGVVNNRGEGGDTMPVLWERTLPSSAQSKWDFSKFSPAVVVINLGTNDFAEGNPGAEVFAAGYLKFARAVRSRYAQAHIFCAVGPMLANYDGSLPAARTAIQGVVNTLSTEGDKAVHYIEFPEQGANGYGCDWHPSLKEHELMAARLTSEIKSKLGW